MRRGQRRAESLRSSATMTTISPTTRATSSLTLRRRRHVFQEAAAARTMIERAKVISIKPAKRKSWQGVRQWRISCMALGAGYRTAHPGYRPSKAKCRMFTRDDFVCEPEINAYRCPAGKLLTYRGIGRASRVYTYNASRQDCAACPLKARCMAGRGRHLVVNFDEPARKRTKELGGTEAYWRSWRERKKVRCTSLNLKT